jgi:myo-inositol-1(or 4)-monophosphatase
MPASPARAARTKRNGQVDFDTWLAAAHTFADASGKAILPHFRRRIAVDNKDGAGGFDPVTAADRAAERAIAKALKARFPNHGIAGEEYGTKRGDAQHCWVVDPIDGTKAFILGLPTWGTLIGLLDNGAPVLGVMDQPYTRERFWSTRTAAMMRSADGKERRLKTRDCTRLADAMLSTTSPDMFSAGFEADRFQAMRKATRMTRYGSDCYAYCLIAAGFVDIVVEAGLKPVDIVALIPIIEKAGGCVTSWDGGSPVNGGRVVASANTKLHAAALKVLAG